MNHRLSLLIISLFSFLWVLSSCNLDVVDPITPAQKWNIRLGSLQYDEGHAVLVKGDDIFVLGREKNASAINELVLYKLDKTGQVVDRLGFNVEAYGGHMQFGVNNDIIVVYNSAGYKLTAAKVNISNLSLGIKKTYYGTDPQSLVVTSNGEVVISGYQLSSTFNSGIFYLDYKGRMMRLSASLDSLWAKNYYDTEEGSLYGVVQTPSFEIVSVGSMVPAGASTRNALIMKTNSSGSISDFGNLGNATNSESFRDVVREENGNYVCAGITSVSGVYDVYMARVDNNLDKLIEKSGYPQLSSTNEIIYDIEQTTDGGFIVAGYIWTDGSEADMLLLKLDASLNYVWHRTYGGIYRDYGYDVSQTSDGGYVLVGFTAVDESNYDINIVKTDANGLAE